MDYYLRELSRADLPRINAWRADRNVVDSLGGAFRYVGLEADDNWFSQYQASRANAVRLAICESASHDIVGAVYLLGIDWLNRSAELSVWIGDRSHQGKGAGRFACTQLLRHAFIDLNLHRIHLTALASNDRAIKLYQSIGFVEEGRLRQVVFKNGQYLDMVQMALLASDPGAVKINE